jgi:hypothetical protein
VTSFIITGHYRGRTASFCRTTALGALEKAVELIGRKFDNVRIAVGGQRYEAAVFVRRYIDPAEWLISPQHPSSRSRH